MELNTPIQGTVSTLGRALKLTFVSTLFVTLFTISAAHTTQASPSSNVRADVIYGDDDRKDMYEITDQYWNTVSRSTVALFEKRKVRVSGQAARLSTDVLGQEYHLCTDEPFWNQSTGAFCSGTLVAPDLVLTAGHCITNASDCQNTLLVFDFAIHRPEDQRINQVASSSVYQCGSIVQQKLEATGEDWALIRLTRAVTDRAPAALNRSSILTNGAGLVLVGHPSGLPTKVAGGAWVRNDSNPYYVVANTDSYGGNSGSGVFNAQTGLLEGVLVRGHDDYEQRPGDNCVQSVRCANDACNGEEITRVSLAAAHIPTATPSPTFPGQDPIWQPAPVDPGFGGGNPVVPNPGWGWIP